MISHHFRSVPKEKKLQCARAVNVCVLFEQFIVSANIKIHFARLSTVSRCEFVNTKRQKKHTHNIYLCIIEERKKYVSVV